MSKERRLERRKEAIYGSSSSRERKGEEGFFSLGRKKCLEKKRKKEMFSLFSYRRDLSFFPKEREDRWSEKRKARSHEKKGNRRGVEGK